MFPIADIITPNIPEAECLSGFEILSKADMVRAAKTIARECKGSVLIKGGHLDECADDFLLAEEKEIWLPGKRIDNPNTHGTGCTLSSAIACNLAAGQDVKQAVRNAKDYLAGALAAQLDLGKGSGPLDHGYKI